MHLIAESNTDQFPRSIASRGTQPSPDRSDGDDNGGPNNSTVSQPKMLLFGGVRETKQWEWCGVSGFGKSRITAWSVQASRPHFPQRGGCQCPNKPPTLHAICTARTSGYLGTRTAADTTARTSLSRMAEFRDPQDIISSISVSGTLRFGFVISPSPVRPTVAVPEA